MKIMGEQWGIALNLCNEAPAITSKYSERIIYIVISGGGG